MARIVNGKIYLSPFEASTMLNISYKTLERWAEKKKRTMWVGVVGRRQRKQKDVKLDFMKTENGHRYYGMGSIKRLARQLNGKK